MTLTTKVTFLLLFISFRLLAQNKNFRVAFVDPTIGGLGLKLETTRPAIHLFNSMVRVFPVWRDQLDDLINYFPLTISLHRQPNLFSLMPMSGSFYESFRNQGTPYNQEKTTLYYYNVQAEENGNIIEFLSGVRNGCFKFYFKNNATHYLRLGVVNNKGEITVTGKRIFNRTENVKGLPSFLYA